MHVSELSRLTATHLITITYLSFQEQKWLKDGIELYQLVGIGIGILTVAGIYFMIMRQDR